MKKSRSKTKFIIALLPIVIIFVVFIWFLVNIFEGEKPRVFLQPLPEYVNKNIDFSLSISDLRMGLRSLKINIKQDGPEIPILKRNFHYKGLFNKKGVHSFKEKFTLDLKKFNLVQGQATLIIEIHDYAKRRGGDGNLTIIEHKMIVDTISPSIALISRNHNINLGGSCLTTYRISADTFESGVRVDDRFFRGVPYENNSNSEIKLCYFAIPYDFKKNGVLHLWAKDRAGNETKKNFFYHIRRKRFRSDEIRLTDRLLDEVISSFPSDFFESGDTNVEKYLFLNRKLREKNKNIILELCQNPSEEKLWDDTFLRMKNSATMARFADKRSYYYKGTLIDNAVHMGVDLASLASAPIQSANSGKVLFAGDLGIYGMTVIIDHGQGLYTLYGHLSSIDVIAESSVTKGETIGLTGTTGLATGDHLHFGFLVQGVPVNPIEWWDSHWIKDNVYRKLDLTKKFSER